MRIFIEYVKKKNFALAKRLSSKQKEEILNSFTKGKNIDELSIEFNCNKLTISRNLKKFLGEDKYKDLVEKNKFNDKQKVLRKKIEKDSNIQISNGKFNNQKKVNQDETFENYLEFDTFTEIAPLNQEIENAPRKDLSSIPISEIDLPKIGYIIVNDKVDLQIKLLEDYPEWSFLSSSELNRKTIEIYLDLKNAKRFCKPNHKVIKVPNTEVFKIVSPILLSKGISRIVYDSNLISL